MIASAESCIFENAVEGDTPRLKVRGHIPEDLIGTRYLLNGPARFNVGDLERHHWLDGDGLVRQLYFSESGPQFRSRYVRTQRFEEESQAGTALYRSFGTAFEGDRLRQRLSLASPANVSVYAYGQRLLAYGEQSLPYELDRELNTLGEWTDNERFKGITPLSAHPKSDPHSQQMFNFGIVFFGGKGHLNMLAYGEDLQFQASAKVPLPKGNYVHDFALSPRFACFHLSPYQLDVFAFARSGKSLQEALSWQDGEGSELLILNRETGAEQKRIQLGRKGFSLHTANAFEDGETLIVDLVETPRPYFDRYVAEPHMFNEIEACELVRYVIDIQTWDLIFTHTIAGDFHFDFPSVARSRKCRNYRYVWALGMPDQQLQVPKFYDRLLRFDWRRAAKPTVWQAPKGWFLGGEPCFLGEDEDKGVVLLQTFNPEERSSRYVLFDAHHIEAGPMTQIDLEHFDPPGFHSSYY